MTETQPIDKSVLTQEIAAPNATVGVRSPITNYPGDNLNPIRLASILRAADHGYPLPYFELAEQIEERDLHYAGVLATRKRSVSQLDITVEAVSEKSDDVAIADMVRAWIRRDTLGDDVFDMLDAIGKGISQTEIIWDTSEGQWTPKWLEWRDPRFFEFDRANGSMPLLRVAGGVTQPLPPFKFISTRIRAKSGLPIRSGLARIAAWAWMFKTMTVKDWAIFCQNYGQPIRVGKYEIGASDQDRDILYEAVSSIAGDCAAMIPASMSIEFLEAKSIANAPDLYEKRADWLDRQISKAVLGQTTTTDAVSGGHAVSQEHRQVQEDIERADARALAATLNRDLIIPWIILERGPQKDYPRLIIGRPEEANIQLIVDSVAKLIPLGLRVDAGQMRDFLGLVEPDPDAEVLQAPAAAPAPPTTDVAPPDPTLQAAMQRIATLKAEDAPDRDAIDAAITAILADQGWEPMIAPMIAGLEHKLTIAASLDDVRRILADHLAGMDVTRLADILAKAGFSAVIAGNAGEKLSSMQ